jgi:hypothetical protein
MLLPVMGGGRLGEGEAGCDGGSGEGRESGGGDWKLNGPPSARHHKASELADIAP